MLFSESKVLFPYKSYKKDISFFSEIRLGWKIGRTFAPSKDKNGK